MTDMTNAQMSAAHMDAPHRHPAGRGEYYAYFAVIFAATLPLACLTWGLKAVRGMRLPDTGPVRAAWSQANIITPLIFQA